MECYSCFLPGRHSYACQRAWYESRAAVFHLCHQPHRRTSIHDEIEWSRHQTLRRGTSDRTHSHAFHSEPPFCLACCFHRYFESLDIFQKLLFSLNRWRNVPVVLETPASLTRCLLFCPRKPPTRGRIWCTTWSREQALGWWWPTCWNKEPVKTPTVVFVSASHELLCVALSVLHLVEKLEEMREFKTVPMCAILTPVCSFKHECSSPCYRLFRNRMRSSRSFQGPKWTLYYYNAMEFFPNCIKELWVQAVIHPPFSFKCTLLSVIASCKQWNADRRSQTASDGTLDLLRCISSWEEW